MRLVGIGRRIGQIGQKLAHVIARARLRLDTSGAIQPSVEGLHRTSQPAAAVEKNRPTQPGITVGVGIGSQIPGSGIRDRPAIGRRKCIHQVLRRTHKSVTEVRCAESDRGIVPFHITGDGALMCQDDLTQGAIDESSLKRGIEGEIAQIHHLLGSSSCCLPSGRITRRIVERTGRIEQYPGFQGKRYPTGDLSPFRGRKLSRGLFTQGILDDVAFLYNVTDTFVKGVATGANDLPRLKDDITQQWNTAVSLDELKITVSTHEPDFGTPVLLGLCIARDDRLFRQEQVHLSDAGIGGSPGILHIVARRQPSFGQHLDRMGDR